MYQSFAAFFYYFFLYSPNDSPTISTDLRGGFAEPIDLADLLQVVRAWSDSPVGGVDQVADGHGKRQASVRLLEGGRAKNRE